MTRRGELRVKIVVSGWAKQFDFAGLSDDERAAIDQWCYLEERKRARGVLLWDNEPRTQ